MGCGRSRPDDPSTRSRACPQDLAEQACHGRLAGAGVAGEHQVVAGLDRGHAGARRADAWMRSRDVSRRTSDLTCARPTRASSSASSSSIDRAGASPEVSGRRRSARWPGRRSRRCRHRARATVADLPAAGRRRASDRAGPGRTSPARSKAPSSTLRNRSMAAISSGDGHEVDGRRGVGEADAQVVVARRPCAAARRGRRAHRRRGAGRTSVLGRSSHAPLPGEQLSISRSWVRRHEHGRLQPRAEVVEPRLELGCRPAVRRCR